MLIKAIFHKTFIQKTFLHASWERKPFQRQRMNQNFQHMKFWLSNNTDRYCKWIFEHNIAFWKGFSHLIVCFILLVTFLRGFVIGLKLLRRGARVKRDKLLDWTFLQLCYPHNSTTRQATRHFHCKAFKCWLWRNTTHLILLWWFICTIVMTLQKMHQNMIIWPRLDYLYVSLLEISYFWYFPF